MKKCVGNAIVTALLLFGCSASAAITSTYTDMGNLSSSVLSLTASSVSVQAGDVVVMIQSGNKKDSAVEVTFTSTAAGSFTVLDASTVLSSDPNPDTDLAYLPITLSGTYDFTVTASAASTGNAGLYVLRADSGNIVFLDNDAFEYSGYATVGQSFSITNSLSWTGDAGYGDIIAIGVATSLKGNITADTLAGILDEDNGPYKRLAGDIAVSAGTTAYDIVWDITVVAATESGSAVAAAFAEAVAEPLLVSLENLVTDASGDGLSIVGETNTVQVVIANTGGAAATNVQTAVTIASYPSYFTIITNSAASEVPAGSQVTNVYTIIPTGSAVPDIYTFDVAITAAGGYGDTSTFDIEVAPVEAVLKNLDNLVVDASGNGKSNPAETNTISVIVRNGGQSTASNVTVDVTAVTNGVFFSIVANTPTADLAGGVTQTNEFIIVPALGTPIGDYTFDVSITADGGLSTNSSFVITVSSPVANPAAPLEWWNMNDIAGTDLNDLLNSGSLNSEWNFNTVGAITDGNGSFVIDGDSGTTTRKLPKKATANAEPSGLLEQYASPLTNGAYSLAVNFDSWSFDAASEGDVWKLKAQNLAGADIAGIELGCVAGHGRIRLWTMGATNTYYRSYDLPATSMAGASARILFNFDADTVSYEMDGVEQFSAGDFVGTELAGLAYTTAGDTTNDWATAASSISINSMGLDTVVESAPVAIVDQAGTSLANNLTDTVTIATFTAKAGDVLVLGAAGSNNSHVQPNAVSWSSLDGGMAGSTVMTNKSSSALWYTTVTNGGTFSVNFHPTNNYVTASAYQIRARDTEYAAIDIQGVYVAKDVNNTNATVSYLLGQDSDAAVVEVMSGTATPLVTVQDASNGSTRMTASGTFTNISELTSEWLLNQSDTNNLTAGALIGMAVYYTTNLPVLANDSNLVADASGNGVSAPEETNTVSVIIANAGSGFARNVAASITAVSNAEYFAISAGGVISQLAAGETATNTCTVVVSSNALDGVYAFDVAITADGGYSAGGSFEITVVTSSGDTPSSLYTAWLSDNSYSANTNLLEDANGDGVNNLVDYAVGGAANLPVMTMDGAYLTHVHVQWNETEAAARGLTYQMMVTTNLVSGIWTTNGIEFVGSAVDVPATGLLTVTNRIPMTAGEGFLRQQIEFTP